MYKVKFTPYRKELGKIMLRQTQGCRGISADGRYRFYINEEVEDPDFWVVQGKGIREVQSCNVAPENTLLLTTEPRSVLVYPKKYIRQFGLVCSCQEQTKHSHLVLSQPVLPWFVGYKEDKNEVCSYSVDYDTLKQMPTPKKTKLISVITSNKAFTKGHLERIQFVEKLKAYYGDQLDIFGRGYRDFDDKWDVLAPYKYHIVIENSSQRYYWTEKLADCFLTETFPFYYGCTNLTDYFSADSFQYIDIHDFEGTVAMIDQMIAQDLYGQRQSALKSAKNKAIGEYNMFDYIASLCDQLNPNLPKQSVTLSPCHSMDDMHNFYNYMIHRNLFKWQQKIKKIFKGKSLLEK